MSEVIPLLLGAALGASALAIGTVAIRWAMQISGALIIGTVVAVSSGEAAESPAFIAFDTAQALAAAVLTGVLLRRAGVGASRRDE